MWWGDWDQKGTPSDLRDDVISPLALWRVRQVTKCKALAGVTDDNGDTKPEVNRLAEIAIYLRALKVNDSHGNPIAVRPVLIKGGRIYVEDPNRAEGVSWLAYEGTGIKVESSHPFALDHNVLPATQALGAEGCHECHRSMNRNEPTRVFERLVLLDPFGLDGKPVYATVRSTTKLAPR
jgi:hypothetical protein